jgi:hypothetical protein
MDPIEVAFGQLAHSQGSITTELRRIPDAAYSDRATQIPQGGEGLPLYRKGEHVSEA